MTFEGIIIPNQMDSVDPVITSEATIGQVPQKVCEVRHLFNEGTLIDKGSV